MNILIAANYPAPSGGNFIGSLIDLGLYLRKNGDTVSFVFPDCHNTRRDDNWVHWMEEYHFAVFLADGGMGEQEKTNYLKKLIVEQNIDILHIHFGLFHSVVFHNRKEIPCEVIVHEHMEYAVGKNKAVQSLRHLAKSAFYRVRRISIVSVNKQIDNDYLFARHWFVPNALSLRRNVSCSLGRNQRRRELGIGEDEKLVIVFGYNPAVKGLDIAFKAVALLREGGCNAVLGVVGIGQPIRESCLDYLSKTAQMNPNPAWLNSLPSTDDILSYFRAADVLLSSSRSEAFSYAALEAISQNTPVVCSDIKGTRWVRQYNKSFFYPVEEPAACAEQLKKAFEERFEDSNYKEIIEKYSIDCWCEKISEIYKQVLGVK